MVTAICLAFGGVLWLHQHEVGIMSRKAIGESEFRIRVRVAWALVWFFSAIAVVLWIRVALESVQ